MHFFFTIALAAIIVFVIAKFIAGAPVTPDPWEKEISREEVEDLNEKVCLNCGAKVEEGQYYCPECNSSTGQYTPYLPFVNIPFNYSMHQTMWRKLKSKDVGLLYKITAILFILLTAPIMIVGFLVYFVFKLFAKLINNSRKY